MRDFIQFESTVLSIGREFTMNITNNILSFCSVTIYFTSDSFHISHLLSVWKGFCRNTNFIDNNIQSFVWCRNYAIENHGNKIRYSQFIRSKYFGTPICNMTILWCEKCVLSMIIIWAFKWSSKRFDWK